MYTFKDKVVLVTGASSGIGKEIALKFGDLEANVIVHYHSNKEKAEKIVQELVNKGVQAIAVQGNLTNHMEAEKLVETVIGQFGKIDVLINNAGSMIQRVPFEKITDEIWDEVYNVNVKSVFYMTQLALPYLKQSQNASIVNIASVAGRNGGGPGSIHYASAKGAILTLTKGMAKEFIPHGIRVNGVNPGVISTPFHEKFSSQGIRETLVQTIPVGREGTANEIANVVSFLASEEASYMYGEVVEVNGGQLLD